MEPPNTVLVIHYSCQSFYDLPEGQSPRITSIAVWNLESAQTDSFAIQLAAERVHIEKNEIELRYDSLEKTFLDEFYNYVRTRRQKYWLHWNMRDQNYGFNALAHRYRVLGGEPVEFLEDHLVDLARLFYDIYGKHYVQNPRLVAITKLNRISMRDFLSGEDEAKAFENKQYLNLHRSTLRKVDIIATLARRCNDNDIKTDTGWKVRLSLYPQAWVEYLLESKWITLLALVLTVVAGFIAVVTNAHV